jgi:hypothetical protein
MLLCISPTKVKHHLTCFNNIFSNNELISNRFAVFVTCTYILTYLYNDGMVNPEVVCHPSMAKTTVMHANSLPPFWYG